MFRDLQPIAWTFHNHTVRTPFNMHGLNPPTYETPPFKEFPDCVSIELPAPRIPATSFDTLLRERSSCRQFSQAPLSLDALSAILFAGYGVLESTELEGEFLSRPVPSGGALYPLELYVLAQNIEGLAGGAWHYVPLGHRLEFIHEHPLPTLFTAEMFLGQEYLAHAAAIIFISAVVQRSLWKYEERGYRYILFEAGHVAQNTNLCCGALNLGCLNLGGFFDRDILGILRADIDQEIALYGVAVGHAADTDRMAARLPSADVARFRRY